MKNTELSVTLGLTQRRLQNVLVAHAVTFIIIINLEEGHYVLTIGRSFRRVIDFQWAALLKHFAPNGELYSPCCNKIWNNVSQCSRS